MKAIVRFQTLSEEQRVLVRDCEYFAGELARRFERLYRLELVGHRRTDWQIAAKLARRIRGRMRRELDRERARAKAARIAGGC